VIDFMTQDDHVLQVCETSIELPELIKKKSGLMLVKNIDEIEKKFLEMPQAECSVSHHFGPGLYIREVKLPKGIIAIGHTQKHEHMNVMISGKVIMLQEDGTTKELTAPATFVGKPGRKIGYIVEDVIWQNVYPTNETNVEVLENTYLEKSEYWIESNIQKQHIEHLAKEEDRKDYELMLSQCGFTHEIANTQAENEEDQIAMPYGWSKTAIFNSPIEGKGLFSTCEIKCDEVIAPARINGKRTPSGRYTNHSKTPNAQMRLLANGDIDLVATKNISGCKGGDHGEEITIDYRQALKLSNIAIEETTKCLQSQQQ